MNRKRVILIGGFVVALGALIAVIVLLAGGDRSPVTVAPTHPPGASPTPPTAPLTGLPVADVEQLDHPAVAIKVSDVRQAHPQVGIDRADIVFVEPIGVSYTRLLPVFHSDLPDVVGPVRSMRPMDAPLLSPLVPVFGNTMGAPWVVEYVDEVADLDNLGTLRVRDSDAYVIDHNRPRPDHVFARPRVLLDLSRFTAPPQPYFTYAGDAESATARSALGPGASVVVPYGPGWVVRWTYDAASDRYLRSEPWGAHRTAGGTRISAVNVLVLQVQSAIGKTGDAPGAPVPMLQLIDASGPFVALAGGHSVTGTWTKAGVSDRFAFQTDGGRVLLLSPGNTWVEMPALTAKVLAR